MDSHADGLPRYRRRSVVDRSAAGPGWDRTLDGFGALGGLGLGGHGLGSGSGSGGTGDFPVPQPRSAGPNPLRSGLIGREPGQQAHAYHSYLDAAAHVPVEGSTDAAVATDAPGPAGWAAAPEWFAAPAQPDPATPAPADRPYRREPADHPPAPYREPAPRWEPASGWSPARHGEPALPAPGQPDYDQPSYTQPGNPWPGAEEPRYAGDADWPSPAVGDGTAVADPDALERPPLPGRHEVRSSVRHPLKLAIYALVLTGLVAGTAAWVSMDKSITLTVDGEARSLHTYAGTVHGVLDHEGIKVTGHDTLAPGADAPVKDGTEIVLRRGRLLRLNVDGVTRQVWVTATSVDEALNQVGYRQGGLFLSASRSKRLPLSGMDLTIRMPKAVTIAVDGRTIRLVSTSATVGDVLGAARVRLGTSDRVSQLANASLSDGMTITITRVRYKRLVTRTVIKYKVIEKKDATLAQGTRKVDTTGIDGLQEVTYLVTYLNGRAAGRKVVSTRVLTRVVTQVVLVGTKPGSAGGGPIPSPGGLNWAALAQCESGGNPRAVNQAGPYYGLYQFDLGTWQSNGGTGLPIDASPAVQTQIAYNLYKARGASPWPECGRFL